MPDIVIHRCALRIVRRGGWAWGPEPQKLLQGAVKALPELLARELAALWPDDAEREIAAPIRIRVPLTMSELLAAADGSFANDVIQPLARVDALRARIAQAVRVAFERDHIAQVTNFDPETQPRGEQSEDEIENAQDASPGGAILRLLLHWQMSGVLEMRVAAFSLTALEAWHRRLINAEADSVDRVAVSQETIDKLIDGIAQRSHITPRDRDGVLRRRIAVLAEAMARLELKRCCPGLVAALDRALTLTDEDKAESVDTKNIRAIDKSTVFRSTVTQSTPESKFSSPTLPQAQTGSTPRRSPNRADRHVASALPFLLLGPLSRLGYLKTLAATMEAAECLDDAPLFATALAYKALDPPGRGWRREPAMTEAAVAFAALEQPVAGEDLAALARRISPHLSPLDAALSGALIAGHNHHQPLLLNRTGADAESGFLLVDAEGIFPIRWAASVSRLRQTMLQLNSSVVLVPQATAETELLSWLDVEGVRFITDAPPTRGEHWRALRRPPQDRWWTNDAMTPEAALVRMARAMAAATEDVETIWRRLAVERPSVPLADDAALDRHITMAASVALGTIAWELWREREPTAPHLALERFRDLDARVRYARDTVRVSLPLGRRFYDLRDHGLLRDVTDAPWLDGRALVFESG